MNQPSIPTRFPASMRFSMARSLQATALTLAVSLTGACIAHGQMRGNFEDADTNHDGRVSFEEFKIYATSRLAAANGPRARRFKDLNPQQQTAMLQQRFQKLDKTHKGYLERSDWTGS